MKILNTLTIKHLKMNKKRTIVTIIGIMLSTALMVGIGLLFSTLQDNTIRSVRKQNGDYHAKIDDIPKNKLEILANNHHVDQYFYESPIGFSEFKESKIEYRKYFFVNAVSDDYWKQITLVTGRLPENENEIVISNQIEIDSGIKYQIGEEMTLKLGSRIVDGQEYNVNSSYYEEVPEYIKVNQEKTYKIVGIIEKPVFEDWGAVGYSMLTKASEKEPNVNVYLKVKKPSRTYQDMKILSKNLGLDETMQQVHYNDSLLALYGASRYENIMGAIINVLMIILTLISIGCIVVIYNSFAISVMERKKQFGLFSSIGATKKQLRHTVFFEAIIVGLIGIPLGVLSSFIGIGIVIAIINQLLPNLFGTNLVLTAYPIFLIIPILFMVVTILVSAYLPARKASKITPIEAIRLNDDIKIKNKKLKTGKWVRSLFGIEGEIALKNIKRNKKKYRITIVSLFVSIVLFISFSTFVEYGMKTSSDTLNIPEYDISFSMNNLIANEYSSLFQTLRNYEGVEDSIVIKQKLKYSNSYHRKDFYNHTLMKEYFIDDEEFMSLILVSLDDRNYKNYLKELGLTEEKPILINKTQFIQYRDNNRKVYNTTILKEEKKEYQFNLCDMGEYDEEKQSVQFDCDMKLDHIYITEKKPFALEDDLLHSGNVVIILPNTLFEQVTTKDRSDYYSYNNRTTLYLKASKYQKVDEYMQTYLDNLTNKSGISYFNYPKEMKQMKNLYIVVGILLYGFISLVTLIGVTSVFNTINTSIALRRKEFAMLRSMGLTPHGFNKILYFESFFFGTKSLLYGIPFSFLVILWIHHTMIDVSSFNEIMIPWKSIGIAILAVFIIVFMTMMYATKKMKKENILDAIREENI